MGKKHKEKNVAKSASPLSKQECSALPPYSDDSEDAALASHLMSSSDALQGQEAEGFVKDGALGAPPRPLPAFVWGLLGTLGLWLGFPNDFLHVSSAVLLYPLALYGLGMRAQNGKEALRHGWLTGLLGASAALYWLAIPIHNVGGLPWFLAVPCALFIGAYIGFYGGLFSLATWYLGRPENEKYQGAEKNIKLLGSAKKLTSFKNKEYAQHETQKAGLLAHSPWRRCLALACLWYGLELLRGFIFTGFPWLSLSVAFVPHPLLVQGASLMGAYGLSACYVLMALWLLESVFPQSVLCIRQGQCFAQGTKGTQGSLGSASKGLRILMASSACVLLGALLAWGHAALQEEASALTAEQPFSVIMVEGNVDQNIKWEPQHQQASLDLYVQLSMDALTKAREENPTAKPLLIWPETSMPFYLEVHPTLGPALRKAVVTMQSPLLVGAPAVNRQSVGPHMPFNRAYLIDEGGTLQGSYDKVHLVPFGEYVPPWLQWNFLEGLLQGIGTFSQGTHAKPLRYESLAMGILLCYESIFPHLAQERIHNGANVLINLSNDGWFGHSSAPRQHLQLATMRAIEQGRWLVRSTNTGISAIIDAQGRIRMEGAQFRAQSLSGRAYTAQRHTVFHTLYAYIPYIFLTLFLLALWPQRKKI